MWIWLNFEERVAPINMLNENWVVLVVIIIGGDRAKMNERYKVSQPGESEAQGSRVKEKTVTHNYWDSRKSSFTTQFFLSLSLFLYVPKILILSN